MKSYLSTLVLSVTAGAVLLMVGIAPANAQGPGGGPPRMGGGPGGGGFQRMTPEQRAQMMFTMIEKEMGKPLTPAQKTALMKANKDHDAARKAADDKYYASIAKTLGTTPEIVREKLRPRRGGFGGGPGGGPGGGGPGMARGGGKM